MVKSKTIIDIIKDPSYQELSVYPDIIVHKRGKQKNLLAIEIKKSNSRIDRDFDFLKLEAYTENSGLNNLNYKYGLFISFDMINHMTEEIVWFKNGRKIKDL